MAWFVLFFVLVLFVVAMRGFGTILMPIGMLTLFAAIRGNIGYDTCKYKEMFAEFLSGDFPFIEPGFFALTWILRNITSEPQLFLVAIAALQGWIVYAITRNSTNKFLWLAIFTAVFYYPFFFSSLRNGLAFLLLTLVYLQYLQNRPLNIYAMLAAPSIHFTAIPAGILFPKVAPYILFAGTALIFLPLENMLFDIVSDGSFRVSFSKLVDLTKGAFTIDEGPAWHVIVGVIVTQLVILITVRGWRDIFLFSLVITGFAVADFYFGRIGRVQTFGLLALTLVHCRDWSFYGLGKKALVLAVYMYYMNAFTLYPILSGHVTQQKFGEFRQTETGNYHLWLYNDKNLCQY